MSPFAQSSLAERRAAARIASDRVIAASLPLYVLAEQHPTRDQPGCIEIGCWKEGEAEGVMAYVSPLDAMIDLYSRNRDGGQYQIFPFEAVDPRALIKSHDGWLTVYLVYGFSARGNRFLLNGRGEPIPLTLGTHFQIDIDAADQVHLQFSDKLLTWLDRLHQKARIPDHGRVAQEQSEGSATELDRLAQDALLRIAGIDAAAPAITHCGIFDPIERCWRFVSFAELEGA